MAKKKALLEGNPNYYEKFTPTPSRPHPEYEWEIDTVVEFTVKRRLDYMTVTDGKLDEYDETLFEEEVELLFQDVGETIEDKINQAPSDEDELGGVLYGIAGRPTLASVRMTGYWVQAEEVTSSYSSLKLLLAFLYADFRFVADNWYVINEPVGNTALRLVKEEIESWPRNGSCTPLVGSLRWV